MKSITIQFVFVLLSLFSAGCADYYVSPVVEMPLYRAKGEIKASTGINNYGIYGSAAYSPFNHIGINVTGAVGSDLNYEEGKYVYGEGGFTYYLSFSQRLGIEVTGGYGAGKFSDKDEINLFGASYYSASGTFSYPYLQMALGIFPKDRTIVGIGIRTSRLDYNYDDFIKNGNASHNVKENYHVIEPLLNVKFPLNEYIYINVGYSNTYFLPGTITERYSLHAMRMQVNVGVHINIHTEQR